MQRRWLIALTCSVSLTLTTHAAPADLLSCLTAIQNNSSKSVLVTPTSAAYESDRLVFDRNFDRRPYAIFHPATTADAAAAIQCAAKSQIPIAPRAGGHSYQGYGNGGVDGALVLDLQFFQHFSLNPSTAIVTVGAGTRLGPLYTQLWDAGQYLVPAGTCAAVGLGGHALGGGLGMVSRKYGMLTHNVVGMTMIDARGQILHINATSHSDLFWALRGAGSGSFGLVTEFEIQAYKAPPTVTRMLLHWPLSQSRQLLRAYGRWGESQLSEDMFAAMRFEKNIELQINFLGSQAEAEAVLAPLLQEAGKPDDVVVHEGTWMEAAALWAVVPDASGLAHPDLSGFRYHRGRSLLYRQRLTEEEMEILFRYLSQPPKSSSKVFVIVDIWGGQMDRAVATEPAEAAFDFHRGVFHSINLSVEWNGLSNGTSPDAEAECLAWSASFAQELQSVYPGGTDKVEAYQNYIEQDLPNGLHAYYGDGLLRLQEIKKAVDPTNVFSFPQSIPLPNVELTGRGLFVQ